MKKIDTLIDDIESVIYGLGGWTRSIALNLGQNIGISASKRFSKPQEPRGYLSLSAVGTPCKRKLWYKVNQPAIGEPLSADLLLRFFYGDMIEELILAMVRASGHKLEGSQDRLDVYGIRGHRDCIIDGMTVDVKSCSPSAFKKFKKGTLRDDDTFGYISQLSSYVYAGKDDPLVTNKTHGAFLAVDKVSGEICLDVYDFTEDLETKEAEMLAAKELVAGDMPKDVIPPVPQSTTSPNTKLASNCRFCEFKKVCWPNLRIFEYAEGRLEYLVHVEKEPKVKEITNVKGS